jgi:ABC-type multidrug transport system ATPase subunit
VCQRVGVIHRGRLLATGGVDELGAVDLGLRVEVDPGQHDAAVRLLAPFGARVEGPGVLLILNGDGRAISRALADGGVFAKALTRVRPSLEDRFLTLTTTTEMDDAAAPR